MDEREYLPKVESKIRPSNAPETVGMLKEGARSVSPNSKGRRC
jgi:hypothetical protein